MFGMSNPPATAASIAGSARPVSAPHFAQVPTRPHPSLPATIGAELCAGYRPRPAGTRPMTPHGGGRPNRCVSRGIAASAVVVELLYPSLTCREGYVLCRAVLVW